MNDSFDGHMNDLLHELVHGVGLGNVDDFLHGYVDDLLHWVGLGHLLDDRLDVVVVMMVVVVLDLHFLLDGVVGIVVHVLGLGQFGALAELQVV